MLQGYYAAQLGPHGETVPFEPLSLKPGIEHPIQVQGQFHMNSQSQVSLDDLLILHFLLQLCWGSNALHRLQQKMENEKVVRAYLRLRIHLELPLYLNGMFNSRFQ